VEPAAFAFGEVALDERNDLRGAEVHVGGFPAHVVEETLFVAVGRERSEFNARAIGSEAADEPAVMKTDERVGNAETEGGKFCAVKLRRGGFVVPDRGGRANGFGFAGDESRVKGGDRKNARMAEAAEAGDALFELILAAGRKRFLEKLTDFVGRLGGEGREMRELLPEADGVAEFAESEKAEPLVVFGEDERFAAGGESVAITLFDGFGGFAFGNAKMFFGDGQVSAGGEANEIDGVGGGGDLVKIVDAPDEAAFGVAPGAEIFDVKIADGENVRSLREVGTDERPELKPAIKGGAEKRKSGFGHVLMLEGDVLLDDWELRGEPSFEVDSSVDDVGQGGFLVVFGHS